MRLPVLIVMLLMLITISSVNALPLREQHGAVPPSLEIGLDQYRDLYEDNSSFTEALALLSAGKVSLAKEQLRQLQDRHPGTVGVLELGGLIELVDGKPQDAELLLRQALEQRADIASIWAKLGSSLIAQGRYDEGKAALRKAIELDPDNSFAQHILGRLAAAQGEYAEAIEHYRRAVASSDRYLSVHGELAELLIRSGQPAEAVALLAPLAKTASSSQPLLRLAYAQAQAGDTASALKSAQQSTERFPRERGSWTGSVGLMLELGAGAQALATVQSARKQFPQDAVLQYQHANALQLSKQPEAAEKIYRELLKNPQGRVLALNNLAVMLAEQPGRSGEAVLLAREAQAAAPDNVAILDTLGWVLYRDGQSAEALQYLRQAAATSADAELLCHLAIVNADVNSVPAARGQLQQCVDSGADVALTTAAAQHLGR